MSAINEISVSKRALQKRNTRALIADTARSLFLEQGYEATTTRDIAASSGVAIGTVFAHFPEKSLLLQEILAADIALALDAARPGITPLTGGCEALLIYAAVLLPTYLKTRELSRTLLQSVMFDQSAYKQQLGFFIDEIADRLEHDAPRLPKASRQAVSEVLFATYMFAVIGALGDDATSADAALDALRERCSVIVEPWSARP